MQAGDVFHMRIGRLEPLEIHIAVARVTTSKVRSGPDNWQCAFSRGMLVCCWFAFRVAVVHGGMHVQSVGELEVQHQVEPQGS